MSRAKLGLTVFDAALGRIREQYAAGHRMVVSYSGGKDSTVCLELAVIAARETGCLPVDVVIRDEEIMLPGLYECAERQAERPEVRMTWLVAHQPIINAFNRDDPYWWVFDPELDPAEWVRQPPSWATEIPDIDIRSMVTRDRFPPAPGRDLISVIGLRAQESRGRMLAIYSSMGPLTKPNHHGVRYLRPLYDWADGDVWLAIRKGGWEYASCYDVMFRMGVPRHYMRTAPPTMNPAGGDQLMKVASVAWPEWWDRVCRRVPSVRTFARYGKRAVQPQKRLDETWEQVYQRACIDTAPGWIAERAEIQRRLTLERHSRHAAIPLPQTVKCIGCGDIGCWKTLCMTMYGGDPFSVRAIKLPYVDPEVFRPGAGRWK